MPALVAGIHVFKSEIDKDVDGRNKSVHDDVWFCSTQHTLEFDHHSVACRLVGQGRHPFEHILAQMGEDQPLRFDFG
jgi:hypothetical protein